nr:hypothetical protein [Thioalkalivibrio sp. ALE21]
MRLRTYSQRAGRMPWLSTMGTNAAIVALGALLMSMVGAGAFVVHLPIASLAAAIGIPCVSGHAHPGAGSAVQ